METLPTFIKRRAERSFRYLLEQIEGVTEAEALQGRRSDWPDHRWGIGQDGSIAGIVYHVAAWKQMTLPLFQPGGRALERPEFDPSQAPSPNDWPGIVTWLKKVGTEWNTGLAELSEANFEEPRAWEGTTLPLGRFCIELYEHDVQHAAQIEYLRTRIETQRKTGTY
jgi:hypothetical protein